ncbi:hypothetical protein HDU87_007793 [Geranomyces variabilis]|uniref:Uncharacterized protein n=1 Tax=Geranomyces variabilis TaxID=109894 RepID=A0AAD5TF62_9FUNG|nr:hypothetical protein HDU87_007793 [Geranomyces variabilis]
MMGTTTEGATESVLLRSARLFSAFHAGNIEQRRKELSQSLHVDTPGAATADAISPPVQVIKEADPEPPAKVTVRKRKRESVRPERAKKKQPPAASAPPVASSEPLIPARKSRQPELLSGAAMREYQLVGMEWMISLYENGLNGILADEMGLGKTIQVIAFLAHLYSVGTTGPFLIIVPLSTLSNWIREFARFAPTIPVLMYHGPKDEREYIRKHKMPRDALPVVITTYQISMHDAWFLQTIAWNYVIVDECHRLKNFDCKLIKDLRLLKTMSKLLLTGTPIQNNLGELWSLLNFVEPRLFADRVAFEQSFDVASDASDADAETNQQRQLELVAQLHDILKPFLLRRLKSEVELNLPPKRIEVVWCPMTDSQKRLYAAVLKGELRDAIGQMLLGESLPQKQLPEKRARSKTTYAEWNEDDELNADPMEDELENGEDQPEEPAALQAQSEEAKRNVVNHVLRAQNLQSPIVQLRKVCNHPHLFNLHNLDVVEVSGKMMVLGRLLPALFARGHRVLIFSQMSRMLGILADWCTDATGWKFCYLDGGSSLDERKDEIARFETDPSIPLFFLTTRAGGQGINLTAADTVVMFDSDWNWQADAQAMDRAHRIGQTQPVNVYRLVTRGTVEERVMGLADGKRRLGEVVVHKELFKGRYVDFAETRRIADSELAALLSAERVTADGVAGDTGDKGWKCILEDAAEFERLLMRDQKI